MYKHILIPTDGTDLSLKAVREGIELARTMNARVTLFTSSAPFHAVAGDSMLNPADIARRYTNVAEERAAERLKPGQEYAQRLGVSARAEHVYAEHPYEAIVNAVRQDGCDLVCMASHGRKGMVGLVMGSETAKVLTHSKVPVLVCR